LAAKGSALTQRTDAAEGPRDKGKVVERRPSSSPKIRSPIFAVTDGRDAVGTIHVAGDNFIAIDATGEIIGVFDTLLDASRALPDGGAP
jgi:hypothetical protein